MVRINFSVRGLKALQFMVLAALLLVIGVSAPALAAKGVGINLGSIAVNETLYPGRRYDLATMVVTNTGTELANYAFTLVFREGQEELQPERSWVVTEPRELSLPPGRQAPVRVVLRLPLNARPGRYFAFLAAHPVEPASGGVSIGVAAATRLSFTVGPASPWMAAWFWLTDRMQRTAPWSYILIGLVFLTALVTALSRRYTLKIQIKGGRDEPRGGDKP